MNIVVVNTGVGNVRAIPNMLRRLQVRATVGSDAETISRAECLILPGVGSYDAVVRAIRDAGLWQVLDECVRAGIPTLGICLGMQLMTEGSEEGLEPGFGWIPGRLRRFHPEDGGGQPIRVPHMGWNLIEEAEDIPLYAEMTERRFYFNHSYYYPLDNPAHAYGVTEHGVRFAAGIRRDNLFGVQFHPEKSHRFGLKLLENFLKEARR